MMVSAHSNMDSTAIRNRVIEYRKLHPVFIYERFTIEDLDSSLLVEYYYRIPPNLAFKTSILFESVPKSWRVVSKSLIHNLIFHLGLVESLSYWKTTCSPLIMINAGSLNLEQIEWWKDLLLKGMGEFFCVNNIDFTGQDFVAMSVAKEAPSYAPFDHALRTRSILPLGGGRDSAFTAGSFYEARKEFNCMLLNPAPAARRIAHAVGCDNPIVVQRRLDPSLLKLNQAGYLNGHTPFSACLAFLNAICLAIYDYTNIVIANERSSDEGNTVFLDKNINHQYSKSFAFEEGFDRYLQEYLVPNGRYFSFVRSLYELQIGQAFTRFPELFSLFRSCNKNQKEDTWCGNCPKCLSVFITLYPFVSSEDIKKIFQADYYENENSIRIIKELVGLSNHKPYECVATFQEVTAGLYLSINKCEQEGRSLPPALRFAKATVIPAEAETLAASILRENGSRDRLPLEFQDVLLLGKRHDLTRT